MNTLQYMNTAGLQMKILDSTKNHSGQILNLIVWSHLYKGGPCPLPHNTEIRNNGTSLFLWIQSEKKNIAKGEEL